MAAVEALDAVAAAAGAAPAAATLRRVVNGVLRSNTYLLAAPGDGAPGSDCVVVDPGLDGAALAESLVDCGWVPRAVLCTHGHFDHVGGAAALQARSADAAPLPVYLHAADLKVARMSNFLMAAFKLPGRVVLPAFSALPDDGVIEAAGRVFRFHSLPGHTGGSCAIESGGLLFTGDSLYARHTGLSALPGEDHALLRRSLQGLFAWADPALHVLPGHGGAAALGDILSENTALRSFMAGAAAAPEIAPAPAPERIGEPT